MKILVADNNRTITRIIRAALEEEGHSVETANTKDDVIMALQKNKDIQAVFLDTKFEVEKDGYQLAKKIKTTKDIPIVMLINALEKPDLELMEEIGAVAYLTKPIDSRKLLQVVSEIESLKKAITSSSEEDSVSIEDVEVEEVRRKTRQKKEEIPEKKIESEESEMKTIHPPETEGDAGQLDSSSDEEKKMISIDWMTEGKDRIMEELSLLLSSVREVFERIKNIEREAREYVSEISRIIPDFKLKIQSIPDPDTLVFQTVQQVMSEIQKRIITGLAEKMREELRDEMRALISKEMERIKNLLASELKAVITAWIEEEVIERVTVRTRTSLYENINRLVNQDLRGDIDTMFRKLSGDVEHLKTSLEELERKLEDVTRSHRSYEETSMVGRTHLDEKGPEDEEVTRISAEEEVEFQDFLAIDDI